jgi:mannosyltransferase OCH1-like enzyme
MFTFETADQKEVRRFRIAQFNGRAATARANGSAVTGMVRSIVENKAQHPPMWTITLIPSPPKAEALRRAPRHRVFAEDAY